MKTWVTNAMRVMEVENRSSVTSQAIRLDEVEAVFELSLGLVNSRLDLLEHGQKIHWRRNHCARKRQP